jgi:predicted HTH domain antitoxin
MQTEIRLHIDESILLSLKENKDDFAKELLFNNALILYRKKKLSIGKAAQLAGYDRIDFIDFIDFIDLLRAKNEPIFDYDKDIIDEMVAGAKRTMDIIKGANR